MSEQIQMRGKVRFPKLVERIGEIRVNEAGETDTIVLLNALVPPSERGYMYVEKLKPEDAINILKNVSNIISFIGHQATADLMKNLTERDIAFSRGMYTPKSGDTAIIVRLKKRLEKPEDVKNITLNDIEFYAVSYL